MDRPPPNAFEITHLAAAARPFLRNLARLRPARGDRVGPAAAPRNTYTDRMRCLGVVALVASQELHAFLPIALSGLVATRGGSSTGETAPSAVTKRENGRSRTNMTQNNSWTVRIIQQAEEGAPTVRT